MELVLNRSGSYFIALDGVGVQTFSERRNVRCKARCFADGVVFPFPSYTLLITQQTLFFPGAVQGPVCSVQTPALLQSPSFFLPLAMITANCASGKSTCQTANGAGQWLNGQPPIRPKKAKAHLLRLMTSLCHLCKWKLQSIPEPKPSSLPKISSQ